MLGIDDEHAAGHPKDKSWQMNIKSSVKHSIEKPILLNFVNLSTISCPGL